MHRECTRQERRRGAGEGLKMKKKHHFGMSTINRKALWGTRKVFKAPGLVRISFPMQSVLSLRLSIGDCDASVQMKGDGGKGGGYEGVRSWPILNSKYR